MESPPGRVGPERQHYAAMTVVPEKTDHIKVRLLAIDTRKEMPMGEDTISNLETLTEAPIEELNSTWCQPCLS